MNHFKGRAKGGRHKGLEKKITIGELEFDSKEEADFYMHLERDPNVKEIDLQPVFQILEDYHVRCVRCKGTGSHQFSEKTGNPLKCPLCKGSGKRARRGNTYTADFKVTYANGYVEVIDIKANRKQADDVRFPFKRKLFEILTGMDLVVIRRKKGVWERDEK